MPDLSKENVMLRFVWTKSLDTESQLSSQRCPHRGQLDGTPECHIQLELLATNHPSFGHAARSGNRNQLQPHGRKKGGGKHLIASHSLSINHAVTTEETVQSSTTKAATYTVGLAYLTEAAIYNYHFKHLLVLEFLLCQIRSPLAKSQFETTHTRKKTYHWRQLARCLRCLNGY